MDVNIKDTYYVVSDYHFAMLIAILLGCMGIGYWGMQKAKRELSKRLTIVHIVLTLGGLLVLLAVDYIPQLATSCAELLLDKELATKSLITAGIVLLMAFGQLVYLVNIIRSFFRKKSL